MESKDGKETESLISKHSVDKEKFEPLVLRSMEELRAAKAQLVEELERTEELKKEVREKLEKNNREEILLKELQSGKSENEIEKLEKNKNNGEKLKKNLEDLKDTEELIDTVEKDLEENNRKTHELLEKIKILNVGEKADLMEELWHNQYFVKDSNEELKLLIDKKEYLEKEGLEKKLEENKHERLFLKELISECKTEEIETKLEENRQLGLLSLTQVTLGINITEEERKKFNENRNEINTLSEKRNILLNKKLEINKNEKKQFSDEEKKINTAEKELKEKKNIIEETEKKLSESSDEKLTLKLEENQASEEILSQILKNTIDLEEEVQKELIANGDEREDFFETDERTNAEEEILKEGNIFLDNQILTRTKVKKLADLLRDKASNVKTLSLRHCGLDNEDVKTIMDALKDHPREMELIDFSENDIDDKGAEEIANALKIGSIKHADEIRLNDTEIGDKGIKELMSAVLHRPNMVNTLNCQGNNTVTMKGAKDFTLSKQGWTTCHIDVATHSAKESKELEKATNKFLTNMSADIRFNKYWGIAKPLTSHKAAMEYIIKIRPGDPLKQTKPLSLLEKIDQKIAAVKKKLPNNYSEINEIEEWRKNLATSIDKNLNIKTNNRKNPITPEAAEEILKSSDMNNLKNINKMLTSALKEDSPEKTLAVINSHRSTYSNDMKDSSDKAKGTFSKKWIPKNIQRPFFRWIPKLMSSIKKLSTKSNLFKRKTSDVASDPEPKTPTSTQINKSGTDALPLQQKEKMAAVQNNIIEEELSKLPEELGTPSPKLVKEPEDKLIQPTEKPLTQEEINKEVEDNLSRYLEKFNALAFDENEDTLSATAEEDAGLEYLLDHDDKYEQETKDTTKDIFAFTKEDFEKIVGNKQSEFPREIETSAMQEDKDEFSAMKLDDFDWSNHEEYDPDWDKYTRDDRNKADNPEQKTENPWIKNKTPDTTFGTYHGKTGARSITETNKQEVPGSTPKKS